MILRGGLARQLRWRCEDAADVCDDVAVQRIAVTLHELDEELHRLAFSQPEPLHYKLVASLATDVVDHVDGVDVLLQQEHVRFDVGVVAPLPHSSDTVRQGSLLTPDNHGGRS